MTRPWARLIVTTLSSSGWRSTSRRELPNSGSSSRKRTPRWLRADLAGFGPVAAADQPGVGDGVVRGAERALPDQGRIRRQQAADAVYLGDLQGFVVGHGGQDGGERTREEGFAAARRPAHNHVVTPGRSHLQSALDVLLALDIRHVGEIEGEGRCFSLRFDFKLRGGYFAA